MALGPLRHPRPLTAADLHMQLEKEQEAVVGWGCSMIRNDSLNYVLVIRSIASRVSFLSYASSLPRWHRRHHPPLLVCQTAQIKMYITYYPGPIILLPQGGIDHPLI